MLRSARVESRRMRSRRKWDRNGSCHALDLRNEDKGAASYGPLLILGRGYAVSSRSEDRCYSNETRTCYQ